MEPGADEWAETARPAPGRSAEQAGYRTGQFTDEEKAIVTEAQRELGNKWTEIAARLPGRSRKQVCDHWRSRLYVQGEREMERGKLKDVPFSDEEKGIVLDAREELGNKWKEIAERLPGRSAKQVAQLWHYHLKWEVEGDALKKGSFTREEARIVMDAREELGNSWTEIAERLPSRSAYQVARWWHKQIQSEKRKMERWRKEQGRRTKMAPLGNGRTYEHRQTTGTYEGATNAAEMQMRNIAQEEQRTGNNLNGKVFEQAMQMPLHQLMLPGNGANQETLADANLNGKIFEQAMQMPLHQLMLPGNGANLETLANAIDRAITHKVQRTALTKDVHARTMAEKDQRITAMEQIIAERDLEITQLKSVIAHLGSTVSAKVEKEASSASTSMSVTPAEMEKEASSASTSIITTPAEVVL